MEEDLRERLFPGWDLRPQPSPRRGLRHGRHDELLGRIAECHVDHEDRGGRLDQPELLLHQACGSRAPGRTRDLEGGRGDGHGHGSRYPERRACRVAGGHRLHALGPGGPAGPRTAREHSEDRHHGGWRDDVARGREPFLRDGDTSADQRRPGDRLRFQRMARQRLLLSVLALDRHGWEQGNRGELVL